MLRPAAPAETLALVALGDATGIFPPGEAEALLGGVLDDLHAGRLGEGHRVEVWADEPSGAPLGWIYLAPTPMADRVWDLWWIGVAPAHQGRGIGVALLRSAEAHARAAGGRLLLIETSSASALEPTRRFYARHGYAECGLVPDYYADGDAKVICVKRLASRAGEAG